MSPWRKLFVAIRPMVEPGHRVQQMLRALDDRRSARLLGDIDEAFDAKQARPEVLADAVEKELQFGPGQRCLSRQHEGLDAASRQMILMVMMMVVAVIMIMTAVRARHGHFRSRPARAKDADRRLDWRHRNHRPLGARQSRAWPDRAARYRRRGLCA